MNTPGAHEKAIFGFLFFLFIFAFILSSRFFWKDYKQMRNDGAFRFVKQSLLSSSTTRASLITGTPQPDAIRSWMTFGYINKIFNLDSNYLKTELNISDSKYPNVTILKISESQNIPLFILLQDIKNYIQQYPPRHASQ